MDESTIREIADRHSLPIQLLRNAIEMETDRVTLRNRRASPKLLEMIAEAAEDDNPKNTRAGGP
jgi:hypothetical protein